MAPLAFGKSVFTKAASAAAGGAEFGFVTGRDGSSNEGTAISMKCRMNAGSTKMADSPDIAIVVWFRALAGDFLSDNSFGMLMQGTADSAPQRDVELFINAQRDGGGDSNEHSINLFCKYGGGTRTISSFVSGDDFFGTGNTDFDNKVLDGNWHQVAATFARADSDRRLFLDGVNIKKSAASGAGGDVTGDIELSNDSYSGSNPAAGTQSEAGFTWHFSHFHGGFPGAGACFDIGPTWIYDSQVDFATSSVMARYYNDSNTDGYVTAGSDGQTGGAAEPELFMTTDGSSMANGGRLGTVTFHSVGGTVTQTASSAGPGSGDTRSSANT